MGLVAGLIAMGALVACPSDDNNDGGTRSTVTLTKVYANGVGTSNGLGSDSVLIPTSSAVILESTEGDQYIGTAEDGSAEATASGATVTWAIAEGATEPAASAFGANVPVSGAIAGSGGDFAIDSDGDLTFTATEAQARANDADASPDSFDVWIRSSIDADGSGTASSPVAQAPRRYALRMKDIADNGADDAVDDMGRLILGFEDFALGKDSTMLVPIALTDVGSTASPIIGLGDMQLGESPTATVGSGVSFVEVANYSPVASLYGAFDANTKLGDTQAGLMSLTPAFTYHDEDDIGSPPRGFIFEAQARPTSTATFFPATADAAEGGVSVSSNLNFTIPDGGGFPDTGNTTLTFTLGGAGGVTAPDTLVSTATRLAVTGGDYDVEILGKDGQAIGTNHITSFSVDGAGVYSIVGDQDEFRDLTNLRRGGFTNMVFRVTANTDTNVETGETALITISGVDYPTSADAPGGATFTVNLSDEASTDNDLTALSISIDRGVAATLVPTFSRDQTSYMTTVSHLSTVIGLSWTLSDPDNASIIVEGTASDRMTQLVYDSDLFFGSDGIRGLTLGINEVRVVVTAQSGAMQTYTVMVTVSASTPSYAGITQAALTYTAGAALATPTTLPAAVGGTGTVTYSLAPTSGTGTLNSLTGLTFTATSRQISGTPTMPLAEREFTLTATDGNGATATLMFTITITVARTTAELSALTLAPTGGNAVTLIRDATQAGCTAGDGFLTACTNYTASLPAGTTSAEVTATRTDGSSFTINGVSGASGTASTISTLTTGDNTITILVTSEDGNNTQTYTITATVAAPPPSSDATLSALTVDGVPVMTDLTASGTCGATPCAVTIGSDALATVVAPPTSAAATITRVTGVQSDGSTSVGGDDADDYEHGTAGARTVALTDLTTGDNTITILVTAEDATTTRTYTITATVIDPATSTILRWRDGDGEVPLGTALDLSTTETAGFASRSRLHDDGEGPLYLDPPDTVTADDVIELQYEVRSADGTIETLSLFITVPTP